MIKQVSWADYATALGVIVTLYYIAVIFLYYRNDVLKLLSGKSKLARAGQFTSESIPASPPVGNPADSERNAVSNEQRLFESTNLLLSELSPLFEKEYIKEELIMALQVQLRKYPELKNTTYQISINNYIEMESENKCSVTLSEHELRGLWQE